MTGAEHIAANVTRLRKDRQLTQEALAQKAGISRVAIGKIEREAAVPRIATLYRLAEALGVDVGELVTPVRSLETVRFRAAKRIHARPQILAEVAKWLADYCALENELKEREPFRFAAEPGGAGCDTPVQAAAAARARVGLGPEEAVRDICGLLEENGVKLLQLKKSTDSFFGLSVGEADGGPAIAVNTWDRISVERWIFTAAHELGHLLLHPDDYRGDASDLPEEAEAEGEADRFASHFLMPEAAFGKAWEETRGLPLLVRVLKVKRIFRVSYKTVLYRLVESKREPRNVYAAFQGQHRDAWGKTLNRADEPRPLAKSEFSWNWRRAGETEGLSPHDFVENRLSRLVRQALEGERISLGRAAEILGLSRVAMRERVLAWAS